MSDCKIVVVEDDPSIVNLLKIIFKTVQMEVHSTSNGAEVIDLIKTLNPALFILDIVLPDANGIDLISVIRQHTQAPIIMLSGKNTDIEKISSFSFGADDYVVKPFSVAELLARAQAVLRRAQVAATAAGAVEKSRRNEETLIHIDTEQHRVFIGAHEVPLTHKEFQLLHMLHARKGKVITREILLDNVWGINNVEIGTRAVDACVSRLRKKIKAELGRDVIEAVPGSGYRLTI